MSEIDVQMKGGATARVRVGATVGEVLERLDAGVAGQALVAKVEGREVDLATRLAEGGRVIEIEPVMPDTREGLDVLRHSTAHLLAAAVLDLFPGTKLGIGPALLDDPRFGFFYDVIAPRPLTDDDLPAIERRMRELAACCVTPIRSDLCAAFGVARGVALALTCANRRLWRHALACSSVSRVLLTSDQRANA